MTNLQDELLTSLATKGVDSLATKADLAEVEGRVMLEIAQAEGRLRVEIAQSEGRVMAALSKSETRVTWRMVGATGVMIAAVGLMIRFLG